MNGLTQTCCL